MNRIQTVKVLVVRWLTDSAFVLRVERSGFNFIPGQCVNIGLPEGAVNREYSTYSGLKETNYLEFLIKRVPGGAVSPKLAELRPGDRVTLDGAYGLFVVKNPEDKETKYCFVATGTGLAPFHSFVQSYPWLNYQVLHGVRQLAEDYDRGDYRPERFLACVSREVPPASSGYFHGRVTEYLKSHPVDPQTHYYLCGNSSMINEVYDILRSNQVSGSNIFTEVFF